MPRKNIKNIRQQSIIFDANDFAPTRNEEAASEADDEPAFVNTPNDDAATPHDDALRFISFGSGSSGNCAYIGTSSAGLLIDAGIDATKVFDILDQNAVTPDMVKGVCLTHDHGDHVRYVYQIVRRYRHLRIYCTPRTISGILRRHSISRRIKDYHEAIFKEIPFTLAGMTLTAFDVSHDGTDNAGYMIEYAGSRFVVATDMGVITPRADFYMKQANYLMIESNYDDTMLTNGPYKEYLKARIRNATGHLDNRVAASFIADNYTPELKYVFLCHLSHDNNTPKVAIDEVRKALEARNVTVGKGEGTLSDRAKDVQVVALPRFEPTLWYVLRRHGVTL